LEGLKYDIFTGFAPNVILAGGIIMPPNLHVLKIRRCNFGGKIIMPPKLHLLILLGKQVDVFLGAK
jgi:hypothetical protein